MLAAMLGCSPEHPKPNTSDSSRIAATVPSEQHRISDPKLDSIGESERIALQGSTSTVSRDGYDLRILIGDGRSIVLHDDTTSGLPFVLHRYTGHVNAIRSYLIELLRYEGGSYLLVDDSTGASTRIPGPPIVSPDSIRFATLSWDVGADYDPNLIEIWRIEQRKPKREFSHESETWGPSDAVWQDSANVEFVENSGDSPIGPFRRVRARLSRQGFTWTLSSIRQ